MDRTKYQFGEGGEPWTSHYQRYTVDRGLSTAQAVNFVVEAHETELIDLGETYLKSSFRVVDENGDVLPSDPTAFIKPNYGISLWSSVSVSLNNTFLAPGNDYPYTALIQEQLGTFPGKRDEVWQHLAGLQDVPYTSSKIENVLANQPVMFEDAKVMVAGSKEITCYQRIHSDFLQTCSQLLPNKIQLGITLTRGKDSFLLGRDVGDKGAYRLEMSSVSLFVKRVEPSPTALASIDKSLSSGGKLQYQRLHMLAFPCAQGSQTWNWHNCFNNLVPRRVFVALVAQESYFGSYGRVSTYLESAGLRNVRFCLDGREIMAEPYTCNFKYTAPGVVDWENSEARSAYAGLCRSIGSFSSPRILAGVRSGSFVNGVTIFGVDTGQGLHKGSLDIHMDFAQPTHEPLMVLVMGEYPKSLQLDSSRNLV